MQLANAMQLGPQALRGASQTVWTHGSLMHSVQLAAAALQPPSHMALHSPEHGSLWQLVHSNSS